SVNGFSGTVALTATVVSGPSGLTPHLNPTSISVPSGGNANSTFTVTASCSVYPRCLWTVNVTGTSGSLSHVLQILVCRGTDCPIYKTETTIGHTQTAVNGQQALQSAVPLF